MPEPKRWSEAEMILHARRAIGKVDTGGQRGIERVTHEEIAAMAGLLVCLGIAPIPSGGAQDTNQTGETT
jgi:hypothetical protein